MPGVVVEVIVKYAEPLETAVGPAEPAPTPGPVPAVLQTLAPESREIEIVLELSDETMTPFASVMSTSRIDFETPSAEIVPR